MDDPGGSMTAKKKALHKSATGKTVTSGAPARKPAAKAAKPAKPARPAKPPTKPAKPPVAKPVKPESSRAVKMPKTGVIPEGAGRSPYDMPYDGAPLGAHVSTAGGVATAPPRAVDIGATAMQLFTKQPSQWKERPCDDAEVKAFKAALAGTPVAFTNAHDSYLINLASPDPALRARSIESFECEMRRSNALGLDAVVSHPGNFMDERASGIARNADAITEVLERVAGPTRLLMELTAGQGTVIGSTFEEMAELLGRLPAALQERVGVCLDTAHVYAAGYDLASDFDGVMTRFSDVVGFHRLGMLHLNDSRAPLGSKVDRHELIGLGSIGEGAFRRIMTDQRFAAVPKVLETPKGDDMITNDRRMLRKLRGFSGGK
jgi:deoxyribonuclease-4